MPQVIGPSGERGGGHGWDECQQPGALPGTLVDALGQVTASLAGEQAAVRGGTELLDVMPQVAISAGWQGTGRTSPSARCFSWRGARRRPDLDQPAPR